MLSYLLKFVLMTARPHPIPVIILISLLGSSPKSETSHFKLYFLVVVLYLETCEDGSLESVFPSSLSKMDYTAENVLNETLLRSVHCTAGYFCLHLMFKPSTLNPHHFFPEFICRYMQDFLLILMHLFFILKKWLLDLRFSRTMFKNYNKPIIYFPNKLRVAHIGYI